MQRIAIIGCGGSGKTTIGRRLAAAIGTQITHLDAFYYDDEWNTLPPDKFAAVQEELVSADTWVIEGNYAATLPIRLKRATHVIFLDLVTPRSASFAPAAPPTGSPSNSKAWPRGADPSWALRPHATPAATRIRGQAALLRTSLHRPRVVPAL
jgi:hypothetical protein